jgi:hypothetical protein
MRAHAAPVMISCAVLGVVAGCSLLPAPAGTADRVVDTWPIGAPLACDAGDRCPELVRAGLAGLAARDGAADVVSSSLHREGSLVDPVTGDQILSTRSGGAISVLLVRLADGTERAIGVGFPGVSREPVVFDRRE